MGLCNEMRCSCAVCRSTQVLPNSRADGQGFQGGGQSHPAEPFHSIRAGAGLRPGCKLWRQLVVERLATLQVLQTLVTLQLKRPQPRQNSTLLSETVTSVTQRRHVCSKCMGLGIWCDREQTMHSGSCILVIATRCLRCFPFLHAQVKGSIRQHEPSGCNGTAQAADLKQQTSPTSEMNGTACSSAASANKCVGSKALWQTSSGHQNQHLDVRVAHLHLRNNSLAQVKWLTNWLCCAPGQLSVSASCP